MIAGGDVTIFGGPCAAAVLISGSRARFQGFSVEESEFLLDITGSDNVAAANRLHECGAGILLDEGAARNLVVANVINECEIGVLVVNGLVFDSSAVAALSPASDGVLTAAAGPNNQLLHNVASETLLGFEISVSKTTLVGNVATFNGAVGIDIQEFCNPTKIKQTALSKNVAAQNNLIGLPFFFDIRIDPLVQRPVLTGNTYQTSGLLHQGCSPPFP